MLENYLFTFKTIQDIILISKIIMQRISVISIYTSGNLKKNKKFKKIK